MPPYWLLIGSSQGTNSNYVAKFGISQTRGVIPIDCWVHLSLLYHHQHGHYDPSAGGLGRLSHGINSADLHETRCMLPSPKQSPIPHKRIRMAPMNFPAGSISFLVK